MLHRIGLTVIAAVLLSAHSTPSAPKGVRAVLVSGPTIRGHIVVAEYEAATELYSAILKAISAPSYTSKFELKTRPCVAVHVIMERFNNPVSTDQLSPFNAHLTWWFFPAHEGKQPSLYGNTLPVEVADRLYRYHDASRVLEPCAEAAKW